MVEQAQTPENIITEQVRIDDISLYIHCGQIMSTRGFDTTTFKIDTQAIMSGANLTMEGKDHGVVVRVMEFVKNQRNALGLDPAQTRDLVSKTVDLIGYVRREDMGKNTF